jgi:hypothetical protein
MDLWLGTIEEEPVTSDLFTRAAALDAIPY